mgnify:CR=1 FL=1
MQETKERPLSATLLRGLFLALALAVLALSLVPRAAAAEDRPRMVIPLGQAVGIKLFADGGMVVGSSGACCRNSSCSCNTKTIC